MNDTEQKHTSHWGKALAIGILTGVAAGLFIHSKKGKALTKETKKLALDLQKQLTRKAKKIVKLTQDKYEGLVDDIISHYNDTKELTGEQLTMLKESLMDKWEDIRGQIEDADDEEEDT